MSALYSIALFVHDSVSEYPLEITCLWGLINNIPTPAVVFLVVPSKNSCQVCSLSTTLASTSLLVMSLWSLEFSRLGCSARKFAIAYPFTAF